MEDKKMTCSKCGSQQIEIYRVEFKNGTQHARGTCLDCNRTRDLPKKIFFRPDLPLGLCKKQRRKAVEVF